MKTDEFEVRKDAQAMGKVLYEVERAGFYCGLTEKQNNLLRLLAEETIAMVVHALDRCKATLYLQENQGLFELHLKAKASVSPETQDELRSVARATKAPAKGVKGKISRLFDDLLVAYNDDMPDTAMFTSIDYGFVNDIYAPEFMPIWSMKEYEKKSPQQDEIEAVAQGLEKSIIERYADDVLVTANRRGVEMIVKKRFTA